MLKFTFSFALLLFSFTQFTDAQIYVGPTVGYNSLTNGTYGFGVSAISNNKFKVSGTFSVGTYDYTTVENVAIVPGATKVEQRTTVIESQPKIINANFSYLFPGEKSYFYPTIGINIYNQEISQFVYNTEYNWGKNGTSYDHWYQTSYVENETDASISSIGVNFGGGMHYDFGPIAIEIDGLFTISDGKNYVATTLGVFYRFGKKL